MDFFIPTKIIPPFLANRKNKYYIYRTKQAQLRVGFHLALNYSMEVITINDKKFYSIAKFCELGDIKSEKTVYNMVKDGRVEQKKMLNKSFFRLKDA